MEAMARLVELYTDQLIAAPVGDHSAMHAHMKLKVLAELEGDIRSALTDVKMAEQRSKKVV
jgi:hypothetical protein